MSRPETYIAGGSIRSGSTWQYNVIRLGLELAGRGPVYGCDYHKIDWRKYGEAAFAVIKCHQWLDNDTNFLGLTRRSFSRSYIFSSRRGYKYVLNSLTKFFPDKDPKNVYFAQYCGWGEPMRAKAAYVMDFRNIVHDPVEEITRHLWRLDISRTLAPDVLEAVNRLKSPPQEKSPDPVTLLHWNHFSK